MTTPDHPNIAASIRSLPVTPDTRDGEIAELNAYRSAFGGGEFNREPLILDAETIRQRGKQYDELMDFFNQVVTAINPPNNLTPDQLTPWICTTISTLRSAVETARVALEDCAELIELERGTKGCSGPGDHKDRHADAEWSGSLQALDSARSALTALESRPNMEPENMNLHSNPQPDATALIRPDPHVSVFKTTGRDSLVVRAGTIFAGHTFAHDTSVPLHLNAADEPGYVPGADYVVNCDCGALSVARPIGIPEGGTLLGGFHYAPGGNAPARSGGDDVPAINPFSLWDVGFRPACADPRGMTLVTTPSGRFWCDIYLTGVTHHYGTSKFGVIIATGYDTPRDAKGKPAKRLDYATAQAVMAAHGKGLLSLEEFFAAAFGVTERTTADRAPKTTGLDAPRTSHFGLMQATGNLWVWGHDGDPDRPRAAILGGAWVSDGDAGSRFSDIGLWVADSGDSLGARGRCDCL